MQQDLTCNYNISSGKTAVIYNAVDIVLHNTSAINTTVGKKYKFISVARLSEEKGIERLIHAVGLLSMPFQFYIVGEGNKRNTLQNLINELQLQDKIILSGEKEDPFKGMQDADLFLMGSYYEGFPNVLLEAGALGIPIIAFNAPGGITEIISAENGVLVDDNDILGFAAAIKLALATEFNRNRIIENTIQQNTTKHSTALYSTAQQNTIQHSTLQHSATHTATVVNVTNICCCSSKTRKP